MIAINTLIHDIGGNVRTICHRDEVNPQAVRRLPPQYNTVDNPTICRQCNTTSRASERHAGRCPWCHKVS